MAEKIEAEGRAAKALEKLRWLIAFAKPLIGIDRSARSRLQNCLAY